MSHTRITHIFTLDPDFFPLDLLDDFFHLDAYCQQAIILECVVSIAIDDTAFSDGRLAEQEQFDGVERSVVGGFWKD